MSHCYILNSDDKNRDFSRLGSRRRFNFRSVNVHFLRLLPSEGPERSVYVINLRWIWCSCQLLEQVHACVLQPAASLKPSGCNPVKSKAGVSRVWKDDFDSAARLLLMRALSLPAPTSLADRRENNYEPEEKERKNRQGGQRKGRKCNENESRILSNGRLEGFQTARNLALGCNNCKLRQQFPLS